MNAIDYCLIIDNNTTRITLLEQTIKESRLSTHIKLAMNCGHGLLFLKEIWLKAGEKKILVIMNAKTPIMDGNEFLDELKMTSYSNSGNLLILALNDDMNDRDIEAYKRKGLTNFISSPFPFEAIVSLVNEKFTSPGTPEQEEPEELVLVNAPAPPALNKPKKNKHNRNMHRPGRTV